MDTVSKSQRSYNMSRIKSKNTKPEILVRKKLYSQGIRYRLHSKDLPGKPDISINKYNLVIDIRGCFWHRHKDCKYSSIPKSNSTYWQKKIKKNQERDLINSKLLKEKGYKIFIIWECQTKDEIKLDSQIKKISNFIKGKGFLSTKSLNIN